MELTELEPWARLMEARQTEIDAQAQALREAADMAARILARAQRGGGAMKPHRVDKGPRELPVDVTGIGTVDDGFAAAMAIVRNDIATRYAIPPSIIRSMGDPRRYARRREGGA